VNNHQRKSVKVEQQIRFHNVEIIATDKNIESPTNWLAAVFVDVKSTRLHAGDLGVKASPITPRNSLKIKKLLENTCKANIITLRRKAV